MRTIIICLALLFIVDFLQNSLFTPAQYPYYIYSNFKFIIIALLFAIYGQVNIPFDFAFYFGVRYFIQV
jgi:hypothetical protein